jgi:hypothetical protein
MRREMLSFRGRLKGVAQDAAAEEAEAARNPLHLSDPWFAAVRNLRGHPDADGAIEMLTTEQVLDALNVAMHLRTHNVFRRLGHLMEACAWRPCRIAGQSESNDTRLRGYKRQIRPEDTLLADCERLKALAPPDNGPVDLPQFLPHR